MIDFMHDGVDVFVLPDNAYCVLDEERRSPLDMEECPCGYDVCNGDCWHYHEDDDKFEPKEETK